MQKTEVNHNSLHMGQPTATEQTKSTLKHVIEIKILYGATFPHQQVFRLSWFRGVNEYVYKMRSSKALKVWRSVTAELWSKVQSPQCLSVFKIQDSRHSRPLTEHSPIEDNAWQATVRMYSVRLDLYAPE